MRESKTPIPTLNEEIALKNAGFHMIAGLDEAGRGSIFGPVCVGIVVLPLGDVGQLTQQLSQVRDSKKIARAKVYRLANEIKEIAVAWGVGDSSAPEVDNKGIKGAIALAVKRAWEMMHQQFSDIYVDYLLCDSQLPVKELGVPANQIVKGDEKCLSIACGAMLAKEYHDKLVRALIQQYRYHEDYQLYNNVGYGTLAHRMAIQRYGSTKDHRRSYLSRILKSE